MIGVDRLVKRFGPREAVRDVSFNVEPGEVLGFLGPNGAGKTTTMRMITGFLVPTSGRATVHGVDVAVDPVAARRRIGYLPENAPMYMDMSVEGFLRFIAEVRGFSGAERDAKVDAVVEKTFLAHVRRQPIETLSKGYKQRTAFAQAILHDPPVLILDEPTEGLDPNQKHVVRSMIRHMSTEKVIILSTHILEEVESVCSRVIIISDGRLVADDTPAALKAKSSLHHAVYLELAGDVTAVETTLGAVRGTGRVETVGTSNGHKAYRVYPADDGPVIGAVLEAARAAKWDVRNLRVEQGRLDEVFMNLTTTADVSEQAREEA